MCVIRFIKNILDIKNILGMQRVPVPMPAYAANEYVMRTARTDNIDYTPTFTGTLTVSIPGDSDTYPSSYSGTELSIFDLSENTDVVLTGHVLVVTFHSGANVKMLAINDTITSLYLADNVETLDLRNASSISSYNVTGDNVSVLYAKADSTINRNISVAVINNSSISHGVVWVDRTQTYAAAVVAAAELRGWTVYDL